MVFISHCILVNGNESPFLYHLFFEGFVGVSFFFTLSGFILAYNYQEKITNKLFTRKKIYVARFARIYPLHIVTLLIWIWMTKDADVDQSYIINLIANIFLLQSFYPIEGIKFNAVSWSLSDEMFFYLLFPFLIIWFIRSRKSLFTFIVSLIIVMLFLVTKYKETEWELWLFYSFPPFRLIDFMLGILLYNICLKGLIQKYIKLINPTVLEISAIFIVVIFYFASFFIPLVYRYSMWYWVPICILIGVFYFQGGAVSRFLSNKWCVLLGEISFSFYMFHTMVLWYVKRTFNLLMPDVSIPLLVIFTLAFLISVIVSYFSFKCIETPSNKYLRKRFS